MENSHMQSTRQKQTEKHPQRPLGIENAREKLLAGMPVIERRLPLAGISTAVLEGGDGPPVVLLIWMSQSTPLFSSSLVHRAVSGAL